MNNRATKEAIAALCDLWGMTVHFETTRGNHTRVTMRTRKLAEPAQAVMYIAGTPSDWRAVHNNLSTARRLLRALATAGPGERVKAGPHFMMPRA
ncbi:MAG TPA: hypothetical protein VL048_05935 [Xanthobacteraceae bacterium]|nr:hypothetical protein [Xanthobacteraceae bacterium]